MGTAGDKSISILAMGMGHLPLSAARRDLHHLRPGTASSRADGASGIISIRSKDSIRRSIENIRVLINKRNSVNKAMATAGTNDRYRP